MYLLLLVLTWNSTVDPGLETVETLRYVRPAGKKFVSECKMTLRKNQSGWSIESTTDRGKTRLTVSSQYDRHDRLSGARAELVREGTSQHVTVTVSDGKARVRAVREATFDVPPGVIVTSAPDWTDTVLLCRRYDRKMGGSQSFAGLWIHPAQASQRLVFTIERTGQDTIPIAGKRQVLDRFLIRLRGNSRYAAWADENGKMIKLVPLPYQESASNWLVLEGYEETASGLRPPRD